MRWIVLIIAVIFAIAISGCEQNVDSGEIKEFDVLQIEDTIDNSSAKVKFTIVSPGELSLSEDLSDIGIYLDNFNVGNYSFKSSRNGSQVDITVVIGVDREKLMSWWAGNVGNLNKSVNLILKAYPTFNLENGLFLRTTYQKSGKLYLPLFTQAEIVNVSSTITEIAYPVCGEIKKCGFFINGVNVTQGCYINGSVNIHGKNTSCMVVQSLNNTRLIDALSSHLLNIGTIRYELYLLADGKMLELKGEREFKAVFEG